MAIFKTLVTKIPIPNDKKIKQKSYLQMENLAIIDQGLSFIGGYTNDTSYQLDFDLPVIVFGDHTCCVKYLTFPFAAGADGIKVLKPCINVLPKYLYYGTQYLVLCLPDRGYARHYQHIEKMELPVPPIEEQQRIVTRIEELFSELDSAVETLQKTRQQLEVYRQAVLKEAFDGFAEKTTVREMTSIVTSGSRGWAKYYSDNGAMFIRIGNLTHSGIGIDFSDIQHLCLPENAEGRRSRLVQGDILVSITADLGSIGLIPENIGEAYINQHIALVRFNNKKQSRFMAWYFRSDCGQKELLKNKRGAGKLGLGLDDIRDSLVPVVSDEVAELTVANIESRLSVCDGIEKTINEALQQAEAMRQSILKKAFEGNL